MREAPAGFDLEDLATAFTGNPFYEAIEQATCLTKVRRHSAIFCCFSKDYVEGFMSSGG
jgi:hypothetical protein